MKGLMIAAILLIGCHSAFSQEKRNSYELKGDLIEAVLYHDNGEVAQMGTYDKQGVLHGDWVSFDRNGNKRSVGHYDKGKKVGTWQFYDDGKMKEVVYEDSRITKVSSYQLTDSRVVTRNK